MATRRALRRAGAVVDERGQAAEDVGGADDPVGPVTSRPHIPSTRYVEPCTCRFLGIGAATGQRGKGEPVPQHMPKIAVPVQSAVGESAKPIAHRESVAPTKPILNSWMLVKCRDRMKPENLVIVNGTSAPC